MHHDAQRLAEQLVGHLHLTPAKHYACIFIDTAAHLMDGGLCGLAAMAASYGLLRFVEAYGLWGGRGWAEWFAAVSGSIYSTFERYEFFHHARLLPVAAFAANVLIAVLMINTLFRQRKDEDANAVQANGSIRK